MKTKSVNTDTAPIVVYRARTRTDINLKLIENIVGDRRWRQVILSDIYEFMAHLPGPNEDIIIIDLGPKDEQGKAMIACMMIMYQGRVIAWYDRIGRHDWPKKLLEYMDFNERNPVHLVFYPADDLLDDVTMS